MKYGVYVYEPWEPWLDEFDTLKEAEASFRKWRLEDKPQSNPRKIMLVRIMAVCEEGDANGKNSVKSS